MFQRTRIRLTILNSLVFIILIGVIATIIYFYVESRLDQDVNTDLITAVERINQPGRTIRATGWITKGA
ncbi:hypothetical protein AC625_21640 [Peribacillus loiseleuriae]|uniref:Uncharacterized protein n=1 Tax=Peribacillus loiseleuriae TaxID=1679170 RepID=A0A0K9GYK6_9BACI|nr:hypothetical protein AC625_21640 [Peribacillus loiseleuriae]